MKKSGIIILLLIFGLLSVTSKNYGQCGSDQFLDNCVSSLDTYTFIKAFNVQLKKKKEDNVLYSYVFSKGSTYMVINCDQEIPKQRMIINLYDRNHKLIASSYDSKRRKHYSEILFPCEATGVYYIKAQFEGSKGGCGVCILGFDKKKVI